MFHIGKTPILHEPPGALPVQQTTTRRARVKVVYGVGCLCSFGVLVFYQSIEIRVELLEALIVRKSNLNKIICNDQKEGTRNMTLLTIIVLKIVEDLHNLSVITLKNIKMKTYERKQTVYMCKQNWQPFFLTCPLYLYIP